MRDNSLARQLLALGHDVTMLPTYLPHFLDEEDANSDQPIFLEASMFIYSINFRSFGIHPNG